MCIEHVPHGNPTKSGEPFLCKTSSFITHHRNSYISNNSGQAVMPIKPGPNSICYFLTTLSWSDEIIRAILLPGKSAVAVEQQAAENTASKSVTSKLRRKTFQFICHKAAAIPCPWSFLFFLLGSFLDSLELKVEGLRRALMHCNPEFRDTRSSQCSNMLNESLS